MTPDRGPGSVEVVQPSMERLCLAGCGSVTRVALDTRSSTLRYARVLLRSNELFAGAGHLDTSHTTRIHTHARPGVTWRLTWLDVSNTRVAGLGTLLRHCGHQLVRLDVGGCAQLLDEDLRVLGGPITAADRAAYPHWAAATRLEWFCAQNTAITERAFVSWVGRVTRLRCVRALDHPHVAARPRAPRLARALWFARA